MSIKIIVNCGACEDFVTHCLASILSQSLQDWEAFVSVDPCGDNTLKQVRAFDWDYRIRIFPNASRRYSLYNMIHAIRNIPYNPEDIIVSLDGDDWFNRTDALQIILDTYRQYGCWMTYGS